MSDTLTPAGSSRALVRVFDDEGRRVDVLSSPPRITFSVVERKGSMGRIVQDKFVHVGGWVRTADIAPGHGADLHCDFVPDTYDICFGQPRFEDECKNRGEKLVEAARPASVHAAPSAEARVVGEVQAGARVYLVRTQGEFGRIAHPNGAFIPPEGSGFWVASSELAPVLGRP